jgi:hypothetical protein
MWTARIFFGIAFAAIGFLLWFLLGLIREEIVFSRCTLAPALITWPDRDRLKLPARRSALQREPESITVRMVWWYGPASNEGESSCEIWSS